jgi:hypothetical protein
MRVSLKRWVIRKVNQKIYNVYTKYQERELELERLSKDISPKNMHVEDRLNY